MRTPRLQFNFLSWLATVLCLATVGVSCKKNKEDNESRSIQAILEANIAVRNAEACGKPSLVKEIKSGLEVDSKPTEALERVFAALPPVFKEPSSDRKPALISKDSERIKLLVAKVVKEEECKDLLDKNEEACWKPVGEGTKALPSLIIVNTSVAIHSALIPMAAYAFFEGMQQMLDGVFKASNEAVDKKLDEAGRIELEGLKAVRELRKVLTQAALDDIKSQQPDGAKKILEMLYKDESNRPKIADAEMATDSKVQNFFLAEMTDSFFCSPRSYDSFVKGLPTAFAVFKANLGRPRDQGGLGEPWFL